MMKLLLLVCVLVLWPCLSYGQMPPIGIIDFHGLRSVSEASVRQALQIKEGDLVPESREAAQRRLEKLPNVQQAQLAAVCCEAGLSVLYVGIREKGAPALQFRSAPKGAIGLPETIRQAGAALETALPEGIQQGDNLEDDSQGHALNSYPKVRAIQERFISFAAENLPLLRAVLHESANSSDRALATEIIGYAPDKGAVAKDLVYGMSDPDSGVRNNSMRALAVIAGYALNHPKLGIKVPIKPLIDMLNSIDWTDRNKSSFALFQLTAKRDAVVLSQMRERALPSLVEMSRWKSTGHAYRPFVLLGRVGNLSEDEIQKYWDSGNRETMIGIVLASVKKVR